MQRVVPLPRAMRAMVPKHGAINGVQYFISTISGLALRSSMPTLNHDMGFTVDTLRLMRMSVGAGLSTVWLLPGKRKEGYCSVNVRMSTS